MSVIDLNEAEDKALVGHFNVDGKHQENWYPIEDLILESKPEGGFLDM